MTVSENPLLITASLLRWSATCERHIWLTAHGDSALQSDLEPAVVYQMEAGNRHESAVHHRTSPVIHTHSVSGWEEAVHKTRELMHEGVAGIIGACLEYRGQVEGISRPLIIRGKVDRLERYDFGSSIQHRIWYQRTGRAFAYVPIEIKRYLELNIADRLQMDCYVWLLTQLQQIAPPAPEFWLSQDVAGIPRDKIPHDYDEDRFLTALARIASLQSDSDNAPPIILAPHCKSCRWYNACMKGARSGKSVTVLSLHRETRAHFREVGITSLHQIAEMDEKTLLSFRYVGKKTVHKLKAQTQAYLENRPIWLQELPEICREKGWYFDIETNPSANNATWSIGWSWHDEPTQIVIVVSGSNGETLDLPDGRQIILAPDVAGAWSIFAESVSANQAPIFHWTGFDAGTMRQQAPRRVVQALNHRLHDLYLSWKETIQLPERSNSLKVVAPYAGFQWAGYMDWWAALRDYNAFLDTGNPAYLVEACNYQAGDVEAMVAVWKWLNRE